MSEGIELNECELQEMARVILCEILSTKETRSRLSGADFSEETQSELNGADFFEEERQAKFRLDKGFEGFERRRVAFENVDGIQRQFVQGDEDGKLVPRLSHGELLARRAESRRRGDDLLIGNRVASAENDGKSVKRYGNLTQAELSEKLSDIFCRDARRYDGAYERY